MQTSDFDFNLPKSFIAQNPADPRDSSKLMVVDKKKKEVSHHSFYDIINFLNKGDLVVWNNSKVFKARLKGFIEMDSEVVNLPKKNNKVLNVPNVEIFLVRPMENLGVWKVLAKPAKKLRLGMRIRFAKDFSAEVLFKKKDGTLLLQFNEDDMLVRAKANKYGEVPTPPYVEKKIEQEELSKKYQTVYAKEEGSVAAPTAGFHFTPKLIELLEKKGVEFAEVTLHVGLGTFLPVKTEDIKDHKMHSECVELTDKNASLINQAKIEGRRVIAVGTTTVRTLEGLAVTQCETITQQPRLRSYTGDVNIFIFPGFKFKIIDALITNFHLPKSTLLMLVSAFAGDREFILKCYEEAKKQNYRFYSFGDAMFLK